MPKRASVWIEREKALFYGPQSVTRHRHLNLIYVAKVSFCRPRGEPRIPGWKVGWTTNLPWRLADLQHGHGGEVTLVALGVGAYREEQAFHAAIAAPRSPDKRGWEWYLATPEFDAWLATFPAVWRGSVRCSDREPGTMWQKALGIADTIVTRLADDLGVAQ